MAYKDFDGLSNGASEQTSGNLQTFSADSAHIDLPDASYIRDANYERDGADLVLDGPHGTVTIEGYFSAADAPILSAPDGSSLTPELVNSFAKSPSQYASNLSANDESPVGLVQEITGEATVTHTDGSIEPITLGTEIYQGDIVETSSDGAVNIVFSDESSFAVSEDARLAIDEYVYDPTTSEGAQDFSVLKGVFVFTSGLVGRDDPDDVNIETPSGSIGIRGTIIAGDVNEGEITVVEGAIVLRDHGGNEMTLASQYETAKFEPGKGILNQGRMSANDMSQKFSSISKVSPTLFSSVNDTAAEAVDETAPQAPVDGEEAANDADGSVDQDGDNQVDGTVEDAGEAGGEGEAGEAPADDGLDAGAEEIGGEMQQPQQPEGQTMEMMGDPIADGMNPADGEGRAMEGMMDKMVKMAKMRAAQEMLQQDGAGDAPDGNPDGSMADGMHTNMPTDPYYVDHNEPISPAEAPQVAFSELIESSGNYHADRGGVTYIDDIGAGTTFTNLDATSSMQHQDFSVFTAGGQDTVLIQNLTAAAPNDPFLSAGSLRLNTIHTGVGDDVIDLKLTNGGGHTNLKIASINGGDGEDTLHITASNPLDFSHAGGFHEIKGIEKLNFVGSETETLTLNEELLEQMAATSSATAGTSDYYDQVLYIDFDDSDEVNLNFNNEWTDETSTAHTNGVGTQYNAYVHNDSGVTILVDNGASLSVTGI